MLGRLITALLWRPYELACRRFPLVPLRATVTPLNEHVEMIRIENAVTRAITWLGGGYDYSVSYLIDRTLLIDTGFPWARRSLRRTLLELGANNTLTAVVNTHHHEDHIGNNDLIGELCDAPIFAHRLAVGDIRHPSELPWYRRFMFGPLTASPVQQVPAYIETAQCRLDVHHMPGHSDDHICLFEPDRGWLFSGDLYVAAEIDSQLSDVDGPAWIRSLEHAMRLAPRAMYDSHGMIVEGEDAVMQTLQRKHVFLVRLRDAINQAAIGTASVREITRTVFGSKGFVDTVSFSDGWLSLLTASDFSRSNVVRSFLRVQSHVGEAAELA
ncbi:MAG: MBL fold metallo-hydrolase [bacterium]|nr:MBL fold metallo-hydrolase [Candidatus Kapabacteria bacterium]